MSEYYIPMEPAWVRTMHAFIPRVRAGDTIYVCNSTQHHIVTYNLKQKRPDLRLGDVEIVISPSQVDEYARRPAS